MKNAVTKSKKCNGCGDPFRPVRPLQKACSMHCAMILGKEKTAADEKKRDRVKRESLKTRSAWLKDAQTQFNRYIRLRDEKEPCISCGQSSGAKINAGHYLSTGARPELRFEPLNCHKQCEKCNSWLSGNAVMYRKRLIDKIGIEKVEWLEGPHDPKKYTIDELKEIKRVYTEKAKEITRRSGLVWLGESS